MCDLVGKFIADLFLDQRVRVKGIHNVFHVGVDIVSSRHYFVVVEACRQRKWQEQHLEGGERRPPVFSLRSASNPVASKYHIYFVVHPNFLSRTQKSFLVQCLSTFGKVHVWSSRLCWYLCPWCNVMEIAFWHFTTTCAFGPHQASAMVSQR